MVENLSKYALSVSVCLRTLAENSVELRLSVQAKEMGRIQTAINAQVEGYDDDDDDGGGGVQSGDEGYFGDGDH